MRRRSGGSKGTRILTRLIHRHLARGASVSISLLLSGYDRDTLREVPSQTLLTTSDVRGAPGYVRRSSTRAGGCELDRLHSLQHNSARNVLPRAGKDVPA